MIQQSQAQSPCPIEPNPPNTCPLPNGLTCSCCGTCDVPELSDSNDPCWLLSFIDGGDNCDPQGPDGGTSGADGTDLIDFDGDGDLDVVTGWEESGNILVYLNPCNPTDPHLKNGCSTGNAVMAEWPKVNVSPTVTIKDIEDAVFADLNGDCVPESVISAMEGETDKVCVHTYQPFNWPPPLCPGNPILCELNWSSGCLDSHKNHMRARYGQLYPRNKDRAAALPRSCIAGNADGCNDIVVGAKTSDGNSDVMLFWFECPAAGPGIANLGDWVRHDIGKGVWFMSVEVLDMDGDSDLDVLFSDRNRVGWFENPYYVFTGEGPDVDLARIRASWRRHVIEGPNPLAEETPPDSTYEVNREVRWLWYFDIDGGGDEDIVSTVNYDMQGCPGNSTNCTGDGDNPGIRIVAHWYERRIITSATLPNQGTSFSLGGNQWLNFTRHVVAADRLPFRREDNELDTWVSKAVTVEDVNGDGKNDLIFTARGSGHGVFYLTTDDPTIDNETFVRGNETLSGRIWKVRKIASAYINKPNVDGTIDGKQMKYDNVQAVDLDCNGTVDVVSSEENVNPDSKGIGVVWYRNPCGNGILDVGEQCDLGALNGRDDQCCGKTCRFRTGAVCRASASICDAEEVCQAGSGSCPGNANKPVGTPCAVSACDAIPRACNASGACEIVSAGIPCSQNTDCATGLCLLNFCAAACPDDSLFCTYDVCNGGLCSHPPKAPGVPCPDDGDPCTVNTCDGTGVCRSFDCPGAANECRSCIDGNVCGFVNEPNGTPCGTFTGTCAAGACDNGFCVQVPAPSGTPCLTDGNECTDDVCSGSQFLCLHPPVAEGTACGDHPDPNNPCELQDRCSAQFGGTCLQLSNFGQVCRPATGECDQGETCTLFSQTGGVSVCPADGFRTGLPCRSDGQTCTFDVCDAQGVCTHPPVPDGLVCGTSDCTIDTCLAGQCTHAPKPAGTPCTPDANYCTAEVCNAQGSCISLPVSNGTLCFVLDWDRNQCTDDVCVNGACAHPLLPAGTRCGAFLDSECDDPDTCNGAGACLENKLPDDTPCLNDGQACTRDVCESGVCAHIPIDKSLLPNGLCGFEFSAIGSGIPEPSVDRQGVVDFAPFDDGGGQALYAAGVVGIGESDYIGVVRWNGLSWTAVGGGPNDPFDGFGEALAVYDDGNGAALYAAGWFRIFNPSQQIETFHLMKWNGASWTSVDPGLCPSNLYGGCVKALAAFDDGSGPALYVGGYFLSIGATPVNRVVKWNGTTWSSVGTGINGPNDRVEELAVVDLGTGPQLYVGGQFSSAGGSAATGIALLEAGDWVPWGELGGGFYPYAPVVSAISGFDDGAGSALYSAVADDEFHANLRVARWTGSDWASIGSAQGSLLADLFAFDDGTGSALYVAGGFNGVGGVTSPNVVRFRNGIWESLNQCVNDLTFALTAYDDGSGEALILGGWFRDLGSSEGDRVARWRCTGDNDCNDNLAPDDQEPDCNNNDIPDDCDLAAGGADCQPNGILDACELVGQDENDNGVPDDCDIFHKGDWNADCAIDLEGIRGFGECLGGPGVRVGSICRFVFDSDQDDDADLRDWAAFQALFGLLPPGCP